MYLRYENARVFQRENGGDGLRKPSSHEAGRMGGIDMKLDDGTRVCDSCCFHGQNYPAVYTLILEDYEVDMCLLHSASLVMPELLEVHSGGSNSRYIN